MAVPKSVSQQHHMLQFYSSFQALSYTLHIMQSIFGFNTFNLLKSHKRKYRTLEHWAEIILLTCNKPSHYSGPKWTTTKKKNEREKFRSKINLFCSKFIRFWCVKHVSVEFFGKNHRNFFFYSAHQIHLDSLVSRSSCVPFKPKTIWRFLSSILSNRIIIPWQKLKINIEIGK